MLKIFKASDYYPSFQKHFYLKHPYIFNTNYHTHISTLFDSYFAESNFFKLNIEKFGSAKVEEVISGDEFLQKKWAKENTVKYVEENWFFDILEKQICHFSPDIFFVHHQKALNKVFIKKIKKMVPNLRLIIGWDGIGRFDKDFFSNVDLLLTPIDSFTNRYNCLGIKACTLNFAFEKSILEKLKSSVKADISFIGSIHLREGGHNKRKDLLKYLSKHTNIDLFLSGSTEISNNLFTKNTLSSLYRNGINNFIDLYNLGKKSKGSLFGLDMYGQLFNSKIVLNNHLDSAGNMCGNIRLFEATGCGACLVTDYKENLSDYFEIDKEIIVYNSPEECVEKIQFLLNNENIRKEIAEAGQRKTLEKYNYEKRSQKLLEIVMNLL